MTHSWTVEGTGLYSRVPSCDIWFQKFVLWKNVLQNHILIYNQKTILHLVGENFIPISCCRGFSGMKTFQGTVDIISQTCFLEYKLFLENCELNLNSDVLSSLCSILVIDAFPDRVISQVFCSVLNCEYNSECCYLICVCLYS